jgi:hypothetical protein|uniref:Uncharacterized protein n=1 Tax=viral metagenome TaxID=1070528 RepID=A0A6C0ITT9_9ZZZZ
MDFLEYKNYLIANNIKLFDHDYRISYKNMLSLNDVIFSQNQTGGGNISNEYYISPLILVKQDNNKLINLLVDNLVNNNIEGAKFLCNNKLVLKYI